MEIYLCCLFQVNRTGSGEKKHKHKSHGCLPNKKRDRDVPDARVASFRTNSAISFNKAKPMEIEQDNDTVKEV